MNPHLLNAKTEVWRAYAAVRASLVKMPRHQLIDLKHEAEHETRKMEMPFSDRAAAQMVHTACSEILG